MPPRKEGNLNQNKCFMKELIKSVEQAIVESKTYMDVESETNRLDFFLSTRENGDVGNETPSLEDLNEAQRVYSK
jgi:hypothetical protein